MRYSLFAAAALLAACGSPDQPKSTPMAAAPQAAADPGGGDWPQWGRTTIKNMVSDAKNLPWGCEAGELKPDGSIDVGTTKGVLWVATMGSQTYGNPAVSKGRIYVGTNNEGRGDPRFKGDHSLLKCLDALTGKEYWTLTVPKLGTGKVGDWEFLGICSHPTVVDDRVYIMTNRCEIMALDVNGLADGNQGVQDEAQYMSFVGTTPGKPVELKPTDADIIWRYNMIEELGIFQHNITAGSPLAIGDILYCNTSNGVTYDHTDLPSPKAPTLVALNRKIAEKPGVKPAEILIGEEAAGISRRIFHGAWTGPSWAESNGRNMLILGGADGFLYAFDPKPVKDADGFGIFPEVWKYDCNPKNYRFRGGDPTQPIKYASNEEGPSEIMATPAVYKGRIYAAIGQDPEHRRRPGNLTCVDLATGKKIWDYRIEGTMSTCAVVDDLVYATDMPGHLYCFDAVTGKLYWKHDTKGEVWSSPLVADGKVYVGNADGVLTVFATDLVKKLADELGGDVELASTPPYKRLTVSKGGQKVKDLTGAEAGAYFKKSRFNSAIHCSPVVAQGILYVGTFRHLYALQGEQK
jgi:outer membrane protein assembly factor BamB